MTEGTEIRPDGMFILDQPVNLPPVLDMVIVGGGPLGTAAAFRAKELGLAALVIEHDDLMKRIRDYAKDKPILPDFGVRGTETMKFPKGGDLIARLPFDPIDKDEMVTSWKALYRRHGVPAQIGVELTGLEAEDGIWQVKAWNHNTSSDQLLRAKHVVLALGRGVPRRLDISGNVEGMAFRLADPSLYVGSPVCVIGGGTSAAEAVIAISNAKSKAGDATGVYWSYRGEKMPKVSKALAEGLFEAYFGVGNVRYLPKSEPIAVVSGDDKNEYLCVRTDRRAIPERPTETTQLEFLKSYCLACIGEDLPEAFLNSLGVFLVTGGPNNKKGIVVTPLHETQLPNVYLAGEVLSPLYLETDDFDADPSGFREIRRRGNIKSALRDGVFVTEVIAQKLAGKSVIDVKLTFEDDYAEARKVTVPGVAPGVRAPQACLIRLLHGGVEADEFPVKSDGLTTIGRQGCDASFAEDSTLSDRHASISHGPDGYVLRSDSDRGVVFLQPKVGRAAEVPRGAIVKAGKQWLMCGDDRSPRTLVHYDHRGKEVKRHQLREGTMLLGREAPDITLDPSDGSLSRRHVSISFEAGKVLVKDLNSVNGTYLKVDQPMTIADGDHVRLGNQLLRFTLGQERTPPEDVSFISTAPPLKKRGPEAQAAEPQLIVTFKRLGKSFPLKKGQTICEIAEEQGLPLNASCHTGICGSDPIRVISGGENLTPMSGKEEGTLEDYCGLKPGEHRLACVSRLNGPVVVEIL